MRTEVNFCLYLDDEKFVKFNLAPMFILRHFSHHIYDETLRTEVHVLSFLAHLSFAPRFILSSVSVHRGGCSANVFSDEHVRLVRRELSFPPRFIFGRFITISRSKHWAPKLIFVYI